MMSARGKRFTHSNRSWDCSAENSFDVIGSRPRCQRSCPAGAPPLAIKLLSEELVLFRDGTGRAGLLALHCSHRGADLSYGRVEDGGLRCLYHGWLYDIRGRCLEQPGEPEGGLQRDSIRHPAYPCKEIGGMIFAYLGPGEPPLFPSYELFRVAEEQRFRPHEELSRMQLPAGKRRKLGSGPFIFSSPPEATQRR